MQDQQLLVAAVLVCVILLLYSRRVSVPVVFMAAVAVLTATGVISPGEALVGFGNDALIVMMMLMVVSRVIGKTGLLEWLLGVVLRPRKQTYGRFLGRMMPFVAVSSAFMNNTPIVAMLLPTVSDWGRRNDVMPSKLLIPLSFAAILGGMVTLIGTSTNLIVNGLVVGGGYGRLGIFEFTPVGLMLLVSGMLYMMTLGRRLLPERKDPLANLSESPREYLGEAVVSEGSPLAGKTVEQAGLRHLEGLFLAELVRGGDVIAPVAPDEVLRAGDELVLAGRTSTLAGLVAEKSGLALHEHLDLPSRGRMNVLEAVVSPGSVLVGRKVRKTDFRAAYDAAILAVHRRGERLRGKIGEMRLRQGDLLLLVTGSDFTKRIADSQDMYVISSIREIHKVDMKRSVLVLAASLTAIALAALELVPLFTSLLIVMTLFLLTGLLTFPELRRSLSLELFLVGALALAIGQAVRVSGLGAELAGGAVSAFRGLGPVGVLAAVYLVTNLLADFMTTAAAASIVFPFAASAAGLMGVEGTPFFLAVAYGAAANFITPVGYQTNLMIFGAGGYRFSDFLRSGILLKLICAAVAVAGLALVYGI